MNKIFYKMNIVTLMIIFIVIGMFLGILKYIYIIFFLLILLLGVRLYREEKKIIIEKTFIILAILFITHMACITLIGTQNLYRFIKVIVLILPFILTLEIICIYGNDYITEGFIKINKLMIWINIYGLYEFLFKYNPLVDFMPDSARPEWLITDIKNPSMYRIFTVFYHPIIYATMLLITFWINIYFNENSRYKKYISILILINLYATQSRSVWIAFAVTYGIYLLNKTLTLLHQKIKLKSVIRYFLVCLLGMMLTFTSGFQLFFSTIVNRFTQISTSSGSVSAQQRLGTANIILNDVINDNFFNFLFGRGHQSIEDKMVTFTVVIDGFKSADNQYITILWDFGLTGLFIIIILFFYTVIKVIFTKIKIETGYLYIILSILISIFFFDGFYWFIISSFFYVTLATLCIKKKM